MTTNWPSLRGVLKAIGLHIGTFWRWLTEPDETVREPERRRRARLLAGMLVTITFVGIWVFSSTLFEELAVSDLATAFRERTALSITLFTFVVCGAAYVLSRSKHYAWGAFILIANIYVADLVIASDSTTSFGVVGVLSYLILCILLGSLFLPLWGTILLYVACLLGVHMLTVFSAPSVVAYPDSVVPAFNVILVVGASIVVASAMRQQDLRQIQQQARDLVETTLDIARRKQASETLAEERNLLRTLIDNIPDYIFVKDTASRFIINNVAHMQSLETSSQEELVGKTDADFIAQELAERYHADEQEITRSARPLVDHEELIVSLDGREKWLLTTKVPLQDIAGGLVGLVGISRDITKRKRVEGELKRYRDHLEELVQERTRELKAAQTELVRKERLSVLGQLTATVAHEIRNPLGTIRASIFTIGDAIEQNEMEQIPNALQRTERNIVRCDNIIRELLDYTRDKTLRLQPTHIDTWLDEVLDEIQSLSVGQSPPKSLICTRELNSGAEISIDREHLRRAVVNVVDNAIDALQDIREPQSNDIREPPLRQALCQHPGAQRSGQDAKSNDVREPQSNDVREPQSNDKASPGNRLTVSTHVVGVRLEIRVSDTGRGIPADVRTRIFEPLFSTKSFGVGLGLPIVKNIMKQHGGGIQVNSEVDAGTTVTLWLPISNNGGD